jgi:AraC-like DNA-binding protein
MKSAPSETGIWDIPTPKNYFNGLRLSNLTLADNILLFHRRSREFLNVRNFESRPHHRFVLIFNCGVRGCVNVDGDSYHLSPGQAFLIAPLQFHFYHDLLEEDISWVYMTFLSDHGELLAPMRNLPLSLDAEDLRILDTILCDYGRLARSLEQAVSDAVDTNIWILQCNRLLQRLLLHAKAGQQGVNHSIKSKSPQDERILSKVNQFLESDTFQDANITELASAVHLSPSHLRRKFKRITGLSLGNYQLNYRMNRAIKYLVNTDTSLTDIAELSGYDSISAFSRSFKTRFGVAPSVYRKSSSNP